MATRREFLGTSAMLAAAGATYQFTAKTAKGAESPNDRPRVALIGAGGMGSGDGKNAQRFGDIVAVADADLSHAERFKNNTAKKADVYQDYRKVLDRKDVDVVIQGTPDHWHTKINIEAIQAGKDVYGEKPVTLTIEEGKLLRKAVEKHKAVFQAGTQQRSDGRFQTAVELVRNGRIGKLKQIWVALPYYSTGGGPFTEMKVPDSLDWDLYQGQAPDHKYTKNRCHQVFRWWYEYAGGIVTDWGNHHIDIAQWGNNTEDTGPLFVSARGLFPNKGQTPADQYFNTPDRYFARMVYANGVELLYYSSLGARRTYGDVKPCVDTPQSEIDRVFGRNCPKDILNSKRDGITFIGDKGKIFVNRGGLHGKAVEELKENPLPANAWRVRPSGDHMRNFFDCHKSRELPVGNAFVEHRTITICHLTNISLRLGRPIKWDPKKEEIVGDKEAQAMQSREQRKGYELPTV